ncbi:MAG: intracellular sulfur oxidation DsrE/DsrF family protein [Arcticibacterium sp.]|jgi:intracellular sulfur oxidation DsrE/DsrF family protein
MKKIITLGLIIFYTINIQAQDKHKIVFQLATADENEQGSLTRQISNVLDYWPDAEIEVVVHSAAIEFMMNEKSVDKEAIIKTMERGVTFAVCKNTMKRKNLTELDIIQGAIFVPVGIAEIVLKQEAGYAYIKAGY